MSKIETDAVGLLWYKCPNCDICINQRNKFLVHIYSHENDLGPRPRNQDQAIFHTASGNILKITQLPNKYEVYTPKILFCPIEDIPRRYEIKIQQTKIVLLRQTESELQAVLQKELARRKLRRRPRRLRNALAIDEDDADDDSEDDSYEPREQYLRDEDKVKKPSNAKPAYIPVGSVLACAPCKLNFTLLAEYTVHVNSTHYRNKIYFCSACPFQSRLRNSFNKHVTTTCSGVSDKIIKCILCTPVTNWEYKISYLKHVYRHRVDGKYSCTHCSVTANKLCNITDHILRKHGAAFKAHMNQLPPRYTRPYYKKDKKACRSCEVCGKSVGRKYFEEHLKMHKRREERKDSRIFKCAVCKKGFLRQRNLRSHFQVHLKDNPYVCKFPGCGHRSSSRPSFKIHYALHYARKTFPCEICNVEYSQKCILQRHNEKVHTVNADGTAPPKVSKLRAQRRKPAFRAKPFQAPVLPPTAPILREPDEDAPRPEGGMNIGSIHLGDDETIKSECREAMADVIDDLAANGIVKSEGPAAEDCQTKKSKSAVVFEKLMKKDPLVQRLEKEDPTFAQLLNTISTKHTNHGDRNAFPCKICVPPVSYPRLFHLLKHMKRFHPEDAAKHSAELSASELMFACGSCGFQTKTSQQLSRHMKTHNPKKLYCTSCGCRFHKQAQLDTHIQEVHMTEKSYKCTKCDKAFPKRAFCRNHERNVHPPPPKNPDDLICKHCGKKSLTMRALKVHVKLHSKNRTLSYCKICNEKLSCRFSLRRHIQLIHVKAKKASEEEGNEAIPESDLFL